MKRFSTAVDLAVEFRWYLAGTLLTAYIAKLYWDCHRLRAFSGPFLARLTDLWFAKAVFGINQCGVLAEVCEKYGIHREVRLGKQMLIFTTGLIARVGPNTLVTSSPDLVMRMSAARSPYTKADWYAGSRIPPGQDNIFSQQDEVKHARRRSQMAEGVRTQKAFFRVFHLSILVF